MKFLRKYFHFLNEVYKVNNMILISKNIEELPKGTLIVKHYYGESLKTGELGVFACPLEEEALDFGPNFVYISISKSAKIITIGSTYEVIDDKNMLDVESEYLKDKYSKIENFYGSGSLVKNIPKITTLRELSEKSSELYDPDQVYYEFQRVAIKLLIEEHGNFDVLEMLDEDELTPHQYIILSIKDNDIKI